MSDSDELVWSYGPTADDPDPGKKWCACGGEVYDLEDGLICSKCGRQEDE